MEEKAVVVTTEHKGVFFGYTSEELTSKSINLKRARNCIYWRGVKGFLDLAASGPTADCRVGPAVDITLHDITCVANCTDSAVKAWEIAPW